MQADYKKIGIDVQIKIVDYTMLDELAKTGDYDLLVSSVVTANTGDNPNNGSGFNNSRFDELTALAGSTLDATIARNAIINAQQILLDENATIFLGYPKINMIGKSYLKGIHTSPSEYYVITKDLKKE